MGVNNQESENARGRNSARGWEHAGGVGGGGSGGGGGICDH